MSQYQSTLDYLFRQLPMFQRIGPAAMKKDLGNIQALLRYLGHPEKQFPSIHLAGTNGKGSTTHILAAAFIEAGYKTGIYTSPHYLDFRERIKVGNQFISKKEVMAFVSSHKSFIEELRPSFFEITVAMAFQYFARQQVDIAIVETGLGGRLDSTNVLSPLLSIITNIGYDHQQFLGDTLPEIAGEKAGIIKAQTPVVIGETQKEVADVFRRKAAKEQAPLYFAEALFQCIEQSNNFEGISLQIKSGKEVFLDGLQTDLNGPFQTKNILTAWAGLQILAQHHPEWKISRQVIKQAWKNIKSTTRFIGRWEQLGTQPTILADSAHNKEGLSVALQKVQEIPHQQLHIVLGMVADKDLKSVLKLFPKPARYYFAKADIPRGLAADQLQIQAAQQGLKGKAYTSIRRALAAAKRSAGTEDLVFVGGSIFTVAEVLSS